MGTVRLPEDMLRGRMNDAAKERELKRGKREPIPLKGLPHISNPELTPEEQEIFGTSTWQLALEAEKQ